MQIEGPSIPYDIDNDVFIKNIEMPYVVKYLKGIYRNRERFIKYFINPYKKLCTMHDKPYRHHNLNLMVEYYEKVEPYTYEEAFNIGDANFRALVFGTINVPEMITSRPSGSRNKTGLFIQNT